MTEVSVTTTRLTLLGFFVVLVLAWFCYRPALSGPFVLDDIGNLGGHFLGSVYARTNG